MKLYQKILYVTLTLFLMSTTFFGQQDPNYTQYMYNTISINPAYVGSKDYTSFVALARTQWVGVPGAPETQTFSFQTPIGNGLGLGVNILNDVLGPSKETYFDANFSYTIKTSEKGKLAFGLRAGGSMLNLNWSKVDFQQSNISSNENINNQFSPTLGAGLYYFEDKWYAGVSVPNFLRTDHYNDLIGSVAAEKLHYFFIAGYLFDLSENITFKPATIAKVVAGAPISLDISGNFLFSEKFSVGLAYRWSDSISALVGIQVSENLNIGYAYDLTTSNYRNYNSGTHEVMLRYDLFKQKN
jgi:type IX secretion system PorP/SprF family membrane protein